MVRITDLVPAPTEVAVGDKKLPIYGIEWQGVGAILRRHPDVAERAEALWTRIEAAKERGESPSISAVEMIALLGSAVPSVIAAGCGFANDAAEEQAAGRLTMEVQTDLVMAIFDRTVGKDGFGPFVNRMMAKYHATGEAPAKARGVAKVRSMKLRAVA